ncbi:methyl-accepting chemotaxis protein [Sulfitobacter sabulilitoris]|uniref:Methyl-accepting chemotaxis protein n=1 Tax=Sulfitobacter sabulilitoris TaxID=2562655 RepID=A0A5S3PJP9_9RHOB|nr:methyl-accepting chemotaxis protein [Sulfitobacter sabulilitoris]TMM54486.1 methyl-accepting chemotaxis protein [Sulfitobacter sabulilitoris]
MTLQPTFADTRQIDKLAAAAATLGFEIVDVSAFLDMVEQQARAQRTTLTDLSKSAVEVDRASSDVSVALRDLSHSTDQTFAHVKSSVALVRGAGDKTRNVAEWVKSLSDRTGSVSHTLSAVRTNNFEIAAIAAQVNTLAINAKIEAARAGEAGRGFAVVAEAINELSQKTKQAATQISSNIETLSAWISQIGKDAQSVAAEAAEVLEQSGGTDHALGQMETSIKTTHAHAQRIAHQVEQVDAAMRRFTPSLDAIDGSVQNTTKGIEEATGRVMRLIDTSETIVQSSALLGGSGADGPFIDAVRKIARDIAERLDEAVETGRISVAQLFDHAYRPVPGSNPAQFTTRATAVLDQLLPAFQEPALDLDPKVVFCATVDRNGYLPTHNHKFSLPQGTDPVWNMAHCRNRRMFNDRVGLKAGRNRDPFLLQVYRRDMGGGTFKLMKDLSSPVIVQGQHWGGVRLAYSY